MTGATGKRGPSGGPPGSTGPTGPKGPGGGPSGATGMSRKQEYLNIVLPIQVFTRSVSSVSQMSLRSPQCVLMYWLFPVNKRTSSIFCKHYMYRASTICTVLHYVFSAFRIVFNMLLNVTIDKCLVTEMY